MSPVYLRPLSSRHVGPHEPFVLVYRLVVRAFSRIAPNAGVPRRGPSVPNFKRFKKVRSGTKRCAHVEWGLFDHRSCLFGLSAVECEDYSATGVTWERLQDMLAPYLRPFFKYYTGLVGQHAHDTSSRCSTGHSF